MNNYLFGKIKKIAESYGIDSDAWCKKELEKIMILGQINLILKSL